MAITPTEVAMQSGSRRHMENAWHLCRTLRSGVRALRAEGERYTPKTAKERRYPLEWEARITTSALQPFYSDTVSRLAALPFQKAPTLAGELPPEIAPILSNADRQGSTLEAFAQTIYTDAIDRGMALVLVDNVPTEKADGTVMTRLEADKADARPYFRRIDPDNFRGAIVETEGGAERVVEFRFASQFWAKDEKGVERRRERIEVWTPETVEWWVADMPGTEKVVGTQTSSGAKFERSVPNPLGKVPVVVCYTNRTGAFEAQPPMEDLAWQNLRHWNADSMQDGAVNFSRSPTTFIRGVSEETAKTKPQAGPGVTLTDTAPDADMRIVETSGAALNAGEVQIARIERYCHAMGMQPLIGVGGPATATGEVRADMNEKSEAQGWISALEWCIWHGLVLAAEWAQVELSDEVDWTLFRDSSLISGRSADVPLLLTALDKKLASRQTVMRELVLRGVFATVTDPEAEIAAVDLESEAMQQAQMEALAVAMKEEDAKAAEGEKPPQEGQQPPPGKPPQPPVGEQAAA